MDDEIRERVRREAEVAALFNALKHDSDAQVGAIMGPMMGENPEFREHGDEIPGVVSPVIADVNGMDREEKRERLGELAPERLEELDAEDEEDDQVLPDLPNAGRTTRSGCGVRRTRTARGTSATRGCRRSSGRTPRSTTVSSSCASTTPTRRPSARSCGRTTRFSTR